MVHKSQLLQDPPEHMPTPDPLSDSVIVPPSQSSIFHKTWELFTKNPKVAPYVSLGLFLLVGLVVTSAIVRGPQNIGIKAATHQAKISVLPSTTLALPPNGTVQVWITPDSQVSFVRAAITFDKSLIKLNQETTLTTTTWARVISQTSMNEANTTGILNIVVALDPQYIAQSPSGTFQLATLVFSSNTTTPNAETTINVSTNDSQMVAFDTTEFSLTGVGTSVIVNPVTTPTPTVAATPTITPDSVPPIVSITNPVNGSAVSKNTKTTITATASDNIKITSVVFQVNQQTQCTVTNAPYTCDWTPRGKPGSFVITAKALDAAGNASTSSSTVTMQ